MSAVVLRGDATVRPLPDSPKDILLHFAAEAHRRKWALQDNPAAFDALHRLGDELLAAYRECS